MKAQFSVAILLCLSSTLAAQEENKGPSSELGVQLRFTFIGGDATDAETWDNFFKDSTGFGIQYTALWRTSPTFEVGGYLGITYDRFTGEEGTARTSGFNIQIKPQTLTVQRHTIGVAARFKLNEDKFEIEPRIGVGLALYGDVDADATAGGITTEIGAVEASQEFTYELGVRGGFVISDRFRLTFGFAFEKNSAPDASDDLGTSLKAQENFVVDVGLKYVF